MQTETISTFGGVILGYLEHQNNGDIIVKNFYRQILGKYEKSTNTTRNFYGQILYRGNMAAALLVLIK